MPRHFVLGVVIGAAVALLALFHAGPVELVLLRGTMQVPSGLVHLLLVGFGIAIGWLVRDARAHADAAPHEGRT